MKRLYAVFDDADAVAGAKDALTEAGFDTAEVVEARGENRFFDPTATVPEARGWLWGGLLGGVAGALVLYALAANVFWIPRLSPIMTAGPYALVFMGFGLGFATGGFVGGVVGLTREIPGTDGPELVVTVPDNRLEEATDHLRNNGATAIESTVTHHEHPQREQLQHAGD